MKLFQSYIGAAQKAFISTAAIAFDAASNPNPDLREFGLFNLIQNESIHQGSPWGLVSWKFEQKSGVCLKDFADFAGQQFRAGKQCVFINPMIGNEAVFLNVWEQWRIVDQAAEPLITWMNSQGVIHIQQPMLASTFAFCNYFMATPAFWDQYLAFIHDTLRRLEAGLPPGSEEQRIFDGQNHYGRDPSLSRRSFIIERLFSTFLQTQPADSIAGFPISEARFTAKFGSFIGECLHGLSKLKLASIVQSDQSMLNEWQMLRRNLLNNGITAGHVLNADDPANLFFDFKNQLRD